jgi:predicted transcriptional regulator
MKVLLSIKPEFADKIFEGTKLFEFRRSIFKNEKIKKVVVMLLHLFRKLLANLK